MFIVDVGSDQIRRSGYNSMRGESPDPLIVSSCTVKVHPYFQGSGDDLTAAGNRHIRGTIQCLMSPAGWHALSPVPGPG
jgi:hypothetical protein